MAFSAAAKISLGIVPIVILLMAIGRLNQSLGGDPQPVVAIGLAVVAGSALRVVLVADVRDGVCKRIGKEAERRVPPFP